MWSCYLFWPENFYPTRLTGLKKGFWLRIVNTELTFAPNLQIKPENLCDIILEKVKGCGKTVNKASVYTEAAVRRVT